LQSFLDPPADAKPMMRWWWFGPALDEAELTREIQAMKRGGIGGVEVQAVYPMSPDTDGLPPMRPFLSDRFLKALRHSATVARAEGMRIDVTLGSGWPFGGPHVPVSQAAASIRMERLAVPADTQSLTLPAVGPGEHILAVRLGDEAATVAQGIARFPAHAEPREALLFIAGRTGQQVKRAAVSAEGFVIDHVSPAAVANHLRQVGEPLLSAFAGQAPPDAIFSDSLEAYGSSWTDDLPAEFRRRRGYDLMAHLPALFIDGPDSAGVRFDWALTLSELVEERYLTPIDRWARARGTRFRAQVYGFPPPILSSQSLVALPEGEGEDWRSFTSTRWATSAAHLYDKPVVSSEIWTWLHSPAWAATPLDMKMEADRHFLQGVTQLVGHGWPYSPPQAGEPGWAFYAAAALNDHNPWFGVMPDVSRYLQRVSSMLRQGRPANKVALYLPIEDSFAAMRPAKASVNEAMHAHLPDRLIAQILDAGQGFDFIDYAAVRAGRLNHRLLVLPPMERIDARAYQAIADWRAKGGKIVMLDKAPDRSGGLRDRQDSATVANLSRRLQRAGVTPVAPDRLGAEIDRLIGADMRLARPDPALGFIRRTLESGDLYFLVNSGPNPLRNRARFEGGEGGGSWWDPMTGRRWSAGSGDIDISLAPYESRFLIFEAEAGTPAQAAPATADKALPLDAGWTLEIAGRPPRAVDSFTSWTKDPALAHFSGEAVYRRTLRIDSGAAVCRSLDFGDPRPRSLDPGARPQAAVEAPVREAASIFVNGRRVGSLWAPPYRIALGDALKPGDNRIEVRVGNSMLNRLAGQPAPDYRLLKARFGSRFEPQDGERIAVQPSGLTQPVRLIERPAGPQGCD